jgi:hypothetical protein
VFLSTNNGTSWTAVNNGLPTSADVWSLAISGTNLFAGSNFGVFLSTNNGTSWTAVNSGLTDTTVVSFAVLGTNLFAGVAGTGGDGVFLSTNNGTSWTAVNNGLPKDVWSLAISGTNLFAGTNFGVFLSTNNGNSWTAVNTGLTNTNVASFAVSGTNLFAGTSNAGVWRRPLSEMVTGVEDNLNNLPTDYALSQNYPNPFNPSTIISYSLPTENKVTVKIYNLLGQEIKTIVDRTESAGDHQITFNAGNLPSGIYLYRIQAGEFIQTRKMVLLK